MPICNFANLLLGFNLPTISPSIEPSFDFTVCEFDVESVALGMDFVLSDVLAVSVLCCVEQPIRKTKQIVKMNRLLRCIMISPNIDPEVMDRFVPLSEAKRLSTTASRPCHSRG